MTIRNYFHIFFLIINLLITNISFGSKIINGNSGQYPKKTFDFKVGPHFFSTKDETYNDFQLYIGSAEHKKANSFSIAKLSRSKFVEKDGDKFIPLCPEKIKTIGKKELIDNPLFNSKIKLLTVLGEYPIVVKSNDKKIYMLANYGNDKDASIYFSKELRDASSQVASDILKIKCIEGITIYGSYIVAAVKGDKNKNFGATDSNSGISLIYVNDAENNFKEINEKTKKEEEKTIRYPELRVLDADSSRDQKNEKRKIKIHNEEKKEEIKDKTAPVPENIAAAFNGSIDAIKVGNNAEIISDIVDMHWDKRLKRLYIACSVRSSDKSNSGARAIVVARLQDANTKLNNKLNFDPIVCDSAIVGNNQIIATRASNDEVCIQKISVMHTSTLLSYLIVAGGNGKDTQVGNKVYALPLVNKEKELKKPHLFKTDKEHGTLAKYDQDPVNYFSQGLLRDKGRALIHPAKNPNDLLTNNDQAAVVGCGDLPLNPNQKISDIFIANDAVFVCINKSYDNKNNPGIFHSQAIFDAKGRICSWTKWTRVAGSDKKINAAALDIAKGQFWYLKGKNDTVEITNWGKNYGNKLLGGNEESSGLSALFDTCFHPNQGGVHNIFDFSKSTSAFNNFSMIVATGLKKVALIESGSLKQGYYKPTRGNFKANAVYSTNGDLPKMFPRTKFALINGGDLNAIGSISTVDISTNKDTNESWVFAAGVDGLAVLIDENGRSWKGKISSLTEIPQNCKFKKIGNYSFVNKIQSDNNYLYVQTNTKLDRICLSSNDFKSGKIKFVNLANINDFRCKSFNDIGVSDKFALLATSDGLFRVGNFKDIRLANSQEEINWTKVLVPESLPIISKLFFVTPGSEKDFAFNGQVYVLNTHRGYNQARLNRFSVNLNGQINDKTIEPLNDLFVENKLSNFYDFGIFKENFWTDGALLLSSCSKDNEIDLYIHILAPKVSAGVRSFTISNLPIDLDVQNKKYDIFQIGKAIRNSASGTLMINGNFGLRMNE